MPLKVKSRKGEAFSLMKRFDKCLSTGLTFFVPDFLISIFNLSESSS